NWCMKKAGYQGTDSAAARSWLRWSDGIPLDVPRYGCIVVFRRLVDGVDNGRAGHVAFYVESSGNEIRVLGGNQNNAVSIKGYPSSDLLGYLWPKYEPVHTEEEVIENLSVLSPYQQRPNGRVYELSLAEREARIAEFQQELQNNDDAVERARLQETLDLALQDYQAAQERANYVASAPPTHSSSNGGRTNWRRAWAWSSSNGDILDASAPYNDAQARNKPGEVQGENIERVITFLDVENNPRYDPALHNSEGREWATDTNQDGTVTTCTVYVADVSRILCAEIPLQPNRAANFMCNWLERADQQNSTLQQAGWRKLESAKKAQELANKGYPVVATQRKSPAGHVALVRPVPEGETVDEDNPFLAQSGATNASNTRVKTIFTFSSGLPARYQVIYYWHP
ncbi:MAG: TIGR02594 family protein, partial [Chloroflexi bacterium]|nr:TIGR02594 family protein [Chloroflexota bacterium]